MNAELVPAQPAPATAVVEYSEAEATLAELRHRFKNVVFDVTTTEGDKEARTARQSLVKLRTGLDKKRLELNGEDRARIEFRNTEAKRITGDIEALETPIDKQIKAEEDRKTLDREQKIQAELKRVAAVDARIDIIRSWPVQCAGKPAFVVKQQVEAANDYVIDEAFADKAEIARSALAASRAALAGILSERIAHEAAQAKLAEDLAELERLRVDAAQRKADQAEADRKAQVARDAEAKRHADQLAQQAADAAREAAARQKIADENNARIAAEQKAAQDRLDVEAKRQADAQAEIDRQVEELRKANEPAPVVVESSPVTPITDAEALVAAADMLVTPSPGGIISAIALCYQVDAATALEWLSHYDWRAALAEAA